MRFNPRTRPQQRPRDVALILGVHGTSGITVASLSGYTETATTVAKRNRLLERLANCAVYSLVRTVHLLQLGNYVPWEVYSFEGVPSNAIWKLSGLRVYLFGSYDLEPQTLQGFFDFCAEYGVNPASINAMSRVFWERSLRNPVNVTAGDATIGRQSFVGGRKEASRGLENMRGAIFKDCSYVDINAAYPHAMLERLPTQLGFPEMGRGLSLEGDWDGFVAARVNVPHALPWGPLPMLTRMTDGRLGISYPVGDFSGVWAAGELRLAQSLGVSMKLSTVWRGYQERNLFGNWWRDYGRPMRMLEGASGRLGKICSNRLWSLFAIRPTGERTKTTFTGRGIEERQTEVAADIGNPKAFDSTVFLSAIIAGRVRTRLYTEGLSRPGVLYCDTDSIIAPRDSGRSRGWRVKHEMKTFETKGPGAIRWTCPDCAKIDTGGWEGRTETSLGKYWQSYSHGNHVPPHWILSGGNVGMEAVTWENWDSTKAYRVAHSERATIPWSGNADIVNRKWSARESVEAPGVSFWEVL